MDIDWKKKKKDKKNQLIKKTPIINYRAQVGNRWFKLDKGGLGIDKDQTRYDYADQISIASEILKQNHHNLGYFHPD